MHILDNKAKKEIINHLIATKDEIEVNPGRCRYNFRCQYNSVHEAISEKHNKIALCMYIDGDYPIVHFINVDNNGVFIDNTLGHWVQNYKFFLIKYIENHDFFNVDKYFDAYRLELQKVLSTSTRIFSNIEF